MLSRKRWKPKRKPMRKWLIPLTIGLLWCASCGTSQTIKPIIPEAPKLPVFSEDFYLVAPVPDMEKVRDLQLEWLGVYKVMRGQLERR